MFFASENGLVAGLSKNISMRRLRRLLVSPATQVDFATVPRSIRDHRTGPSPDRMCSPAHRADGALYPYPPALVLELMGEQIANMINCHRGS